MTAPSAISVGLISDTHGLLRPQALGALAGSDRIVHAGDIGDPEVLRRLGAIAPVTAVRGNNDRAPWAAPLRDVEVLELGATLIYIVHDIAELDIDPAAAGFHAVVSGHSHRPGIETRDGVLYVNPGSAGPRRFRLPVSLARLTVRGTNLEAQLVELDLAADVGVGARGR
jgi:putative phosphoesterase